MIEDIPENVRSAGRDAVEMYARLRSAGQSHKWAEMCALQQPPGVRGTDRSLMQGRLNGQWLDDMPKDHAQRMLREAKAAGINVSGRFYMSGLADKRGHLDPAAWIDSASDIKHVARERNLTVQGIVEHKGTPMEPRKKKRLSERLTKEMMARERHMNPGRKISDGDLREMVKSKYGYTRKVR